MAVKKSAMVAALQTPVKKISAWYNQLLSVQGMEQQKIDTAVIKPALLGCTLVGPVVMWPQWDCCQKQVEKMWRHPLPKQVATFIYYGVSSVGLTCVCRQQHLWGKRWVFMGLLSGMTRIFTICLQCRLCRMDNICGRDSLRWAAEDTTAKKNSTPDLLWNQVHRAHKGNRWTVRDRTFRSLFWV